MRERRNAMCKSVINGTRNINRYKRQEKPLRERRSAL